MTGTALRVEAPAKVNLFLGVGALRHDGYHDVTTVVHAIDLCDELLIRPAPSLSLTCTPDLDLPAEKNLAYRAAVAMGRAFGRTPGIAIELRKRIPHGAGLGGGSSDAAGVIAALARLWDLDATNSECLSVASSLGADVPLFLLGGCVLLGGRGDELLSRCEPMSIPVAVVKPPAGVPTAAAYAAFDAAPVDAGEPEDVLRALAAGDGGGLSRALSNNMERASSSLVPEVADALAWVRDADGVLGAAMAGSGSAVFALCTDPSAAETIAAHAAEHGWWGAATTLRRAGVTVSDEEGEW